MTKDQEVAILRNIASLAGSVAAASGQVGDLEAASKAVSAAIADMLPEKADGSVFSDSELHAAAMAAMIPFDNVLNRDS
jgi:hypothetical protein